MLLIMFCKIRTFAADFYKKTIEYDPIGKLPVH